MRGLAGEVGQGESFSCSPPSTSRPEPWHPLPQMATRGQHGNKKRRPPPRTWVQAWEHWAGSTGWGAPSAGGEHQRRGEHWVGSTVWGAPGRSTTRGALCGEHWGAPGPGRAAGSTVWGAPGRSTRRGALCGEHRGALGAGGAAGSTRREPQVVSTVRGALNVGRAVGSTVRAAPGRSTRWGVLRGALSTGGAMGSTRGGVPCGEQCERAGSTIWGTPCREHRARAGLRGAS